MGETVLSDDRLLARILDEQAQNSFQYLTDVTEPARQNTSRSASEQSAM